MEFNTLVSGELIVKDAKNGKVIIAKKNSITQQFIQQIINYAQFGGQISGYYYYITISSTAGQQSNPIQVSPSYVPTSNGFKIMFTGVVISPGFIGQNINLYLTTQQFSIQLANVTGLSLPAYTDYIISWTITFEFNLQDVFSPYLAFAVLGNAGLNSNIFISPNVRLAFQYILDGTYLTPNPTYTLMYLVITQQSQQEQSIQLTPSFTQQTISMSSNIIITQPSATVSSIQIYVSGTNANVQLLYSQTNILIVTGQVGRVVYASTWTYQ